MAVVLLALSAGCAHRTGLPAAAPPAAEVAVRLIPLAGGAADRAEEFSGLAWHGDELVMLPETLGLGKGPDGRRLAPGPQRVWLLDRAALVDHLAASDGAALVPRALAVTPDLAAWRPGEIDGFEAIAFDGDTAWLLVETNQNDAGDNPAWLVRGVMSGDELALDLDGARAFPRQTDHANTSFEALFRWRGGVCAVYELNSRAVATHPTARCFADDLTPAPPLAFPHLAYRVTDATELDAAGHLWVLNYRYPKTDKSRVDPASEPLARRFGVGPTHARFAQVERLVELAVTADGLTLVDRAPVQLALPAPWEDGGARNWEGIVRFPGGFLVVTDEYPGPTTLLGFVSVPTADADAARDTPP
ncbi:MAG: hypothetical protein CVU56_29310 [Deltaproteobacteria bacterium HGW-Deltaproteobacteria-14]|nr:MAG: hypothetical protein CVU56_29310 [Deltaproteobacteria bacterium HGW-Deltaproteobacteria-14]